MARKFFYIAAGMLMLALSYHFGASTATAQSGSSVTGFSVLDPTQFFVMSPNGDVFYRQTSSYGGTFTGGLTFVGNFWSGGPTPALHESWGQVKARYRTPAGGSVTPGAENR